MSTVSGYRLTFNAIVPVTMALGAEPLYVGLLHGLPYVWALIDSAEDREQHWYFYMVKTGQPLPQGEVKYVGTFRVPEVGESSGLRMYHVFGCPTYTEPPV